MIPQPSRQVPDPEQSSRGAENAPEAAAERLGPTPERLAKARAAGSEAVDYAVSEADEDGGRVATWRLHDGDVLELLLRRRVIEQEQYSCGKEFYRHWENSGLAAAGVMDPARERVDGGSHKPESETRLWHLQKWQGLVKALGPVHSAPLCVCVLEGRSLEDYGNTRSGYRNVKQAKEWAQARLTGALEQLVLLMLGPRHSRSRGEISEGARPTYQPHLHEAMETEKEGA